MVSSDYFVAHSAKLIAQRRSFQKALHAWYRVHQRPLPWRLAPSLYKTVVSEFMLQQTQVKTVLPYFDRWLHALPDFIALAAASESQVMMQSLPSTSDIISNASSYKFSASSVCS